MGIFRGTKQNISGETCWRWRKVSTSGGGILPNLGLRYEKCGKVRMKIPVANIMEGREWRTVRKGITPHAFQAT